MIHLRRKLFRQPAFREPEERHRVRVRPADFHDADSASVAPATQEERIDSGLRSRRIRTIQFDPILGPELPKKSWLRKTLEALRGE